MKNIFKQTTLFICVAALGACANMSALQTAETLPEGKGELSVGGGYVAYDAIADEDTSVTAPYLEIQYRRGLAEKLDVGAKVTLIGTAGIDGKYQLIDGDKFDLAVGTSLAYLTVSSGEGTATETSSTIIDWTVPVYMSGPVSDNVTLYTSPKFMLRAGGSETLSLLGLTGGVKIGNDSGVMLETTYGKALGNSFQNLQFNAAVFFKGDAWL